MNALTGSTVGILDILLLLRLVEGIGVVWPSSKSPPLTLLEGEVALLRLEPIILPMLVNKHGELTSFGKTNRMKKKSYTAVFPSSFFV